MSLNETYSSVTQQVEYIFEDSPLPEWAERKAKDNCIEPMLQLYTKNGRKHGNATVAKIVRVEIGPAGWRDTSFFEVVTDADSWGIYTASEILEGWDLGAFILKKFPNPKSDLRYDGLACPLPQPQFEAT